MVRGGMDVWIDDGQIVSMVVSEAPPGGAHRAVYTPPSIATMDMRGVSPTR